MTTVKSVIERTYAKVNGEFEAVVENSDDWNTYLNALNHIMEVLAHTPYVKWQIFFDMEYDLPEVVASGKTSYIIPELNSSSIANSPYDHVFIVGANGIVIDRYKLIDIAKFQAAESGKVCTIAGGSLHLKKVDPLLVGATIRIPIYKDPEPYTLGSQQVIIDNVPWLITEMAAMLSDASPVPFIARNADKFYKQSAILMKEMKDNNRRTQSLIIKSITTNRIGHTWDDVLQVMTLKDL